MLGRVERGEHFTVVRGGTPAAEIIRGQGRVFQTRAEIIDAVAKLPRVDVAALRADIDAAVDNDDPIDE